MKKIILSILIVLLLSLIFVKGEIYSCPDGYKLTDHPDGILSCISSTQYTGGYPSPFIRNETDIICQEGYKIQRDNSGYARGCVRDIPPCQEGYALSTWTEGGSKMTGCMPINPQSNLQSYVADQPDIRTSVSGEAVELYTGGIKIVIDANNKVEEASEDKIQENNSLNQSYDLCENKSIQNDNSLQKQIDELKEENKEIKEILCKLNFTEWCPTGYNNLTETEEENFFTSITGEVIEEGGFITKLFESVADFFNSIF